MVGGPADPQRSAGICAGLLPPRRSVSVVPGGSWDAPGRRRTAPGGAGQHVRREGRRRASGAGFGSPLGPVARLRRGHGIEPQSGVAQSGAGDSAAHSALSSGSQRRHARGCAGGFLYLRVAGAADCARKKNAACARCTAPTTRPAATSRCTPRPMCTTRNVWRKQLEKRIAAHPETADAALDAAENAARMLWKALDGIEARRTAMAAA